MKIEIDQSGKIEDTANDTIIADSISNIVWFKAKDKRNFQKIYKQAGKPRKFVYELFSILTSILIKKSYRSFNTYIIDIEYFGKADFLKNLIIIYLNKQKIKISLNRIDFRRVGKKSNSHKVAYKYFKSPKIRPKKVTFKEVLKLILQ